MTKITLDFVQKALKKKLTKKELNHIKIMRELKNTNSLNDSWFWNEY